MHTTLKFKPFACKAIAELRERLRRDEILGSAVALEYLAPKRRVRKVRQAAIAA